MCLYSLCDGTKYLIYTKKVVPSVKQHIRLRAVVYNLYNSIVPTSWRAALYNKHHIVYRCRNVIINSNKGGLSLSDESFPNGGARGALAKPWRSLQEGSAKPSRSVSSRRLRGASKAPPRKSFAEVYESFAKVAHTEGSTKTPWRVHKASSKGPWMNCMFVLDHDCNRVWSILYCF